MRGTSTSGHWPAPGGQEPHEQPDGEGTSATDVDMLGACSDTLSTLAWARRQSLGEAGCSCSHGGACRAIGVGANPLFLVSLSAVCLQGARLHPFPLLLVMGRLQVALLAFALCVLPEP